MVQGNLGYKFIIFCPLKTSVPVAEWLERPTSDPEARVRIPSGVESTFFIFWDTIEIWSQNHFISHFRSWEGQKSQYFCIRLLKTDTHLLGFQMINLNLLKGPPMKYFLNTGFGTSKYPKKWNYEVYSCTSKLGFFRFWESCEYAQVDLN